MTPRQCEIAAESYAACILARSGYDVLVQYGANQPQYDLVAVKGEVLQPVSVKGSQDGGWMLAVKYVKPGVNYHQAIDKWLEHQRKDLIYIFVQFRDVPENGAPRAYAATSEEIGVHLKSQRNGLGHGALYEDWRRDHPRASHNALIPAEWTFSASRIESLQIYLGRRR